MTLNKLVENENIMELDCLYPKSAYILKLNNMDEMYYLVLTVPYSHQGYPSENPEADNAVQVFRMPESNVHSQVLPSTSEVALYCYFKLLSCSPFYIIITCNHLDIFIRQLNL
jgi:hypothetical protein